MPPTLKGTPTGGPKLRGYSKAPTIITTRRVPTAASTAEGVSKPAEIKVITRNCATPLDAVGSTDGSEPSQLPRYNGSREGTSGAVSEWVARCFTRGGVAGESEIKALISEAAEAARDDFDVSSAVTWAEGYTFPEEYRVSDMRCLQAAQLDFLSMVARRLKILAPDRLNKERVEGLRRDNPERELMFDLAIGMKVHLPDGFTPNGKEKPSPLRTTYVEVHSAVNRMLGDVIKQRLAFILPLAVARQYVPHLHLCKAHWTRKKGKASGRPLGDLTFVDGTPLNTPDTAAAAADYYGPVLHPTIEEIADMINRFWAKAIKANPARRWCEMRLWKMDLRGAYTLLSFRPADVGLFAMLLTEDLVYFQMAGIFGWAGTPAAFQVVTRAILWELQHRLESDTVMYVDDIIGIGFEDDIESDLAITKRVCTGLLGPTAVADEKTEIGRRIEIIGYIIDLDAKRVMIARKNFLTTLHGFASVQLEEKMDLRTAQRLASWSSRYGKICRVMRPFCGALNRMTAGRTQPHALFSLSAEARVAIQCWKAMLFLVRHDETQFTRHLESFSQPAATIVAEFDSSLSGAGLLWYARSEGTEAVRGVCAVDLTFLDFGVDSSYQNLAEFLGAILAVVGYIQLGHKGQTLALRGDSITALTWAITERTRGCNVTNASMVWTLLCLAAEVDITEMIHISGKENHRCDALSRLRETGQSVTAKAAEIGVARAQVIEAQDDHKIMALLRQCDPRIKHNSDDEFLEFWCRTRAIVDDLLAASPPPPLPSPG